MVFVDDGGSYGADYGPFLLTNDGGYGAANQRN